MAHELDFDQDANARIFSVQATPWHGLGRILDNPPTIEEGIVQAGLDWTVRVEPTYLQDGRAVAGANAVIRETDGAILGAVGDRWHPVQNREAFQWFAPWLENNLVTLETAGALRGGSVVWCLAKVAIPDAVICKQSDDKVSAYILFANNHNSKKSLSVGFTPIRVVCQNTLSMAQSNGASKLVKIRHTVNAKQALNEIRTTMDLLTADFKITADKYRELLKYQVNENRPTGRVPAQTGRRQPPVPPGRRQ